MNFWRQVLIEWKQRGSSLDDYETTVRDVATRHPELINVYNESGLVPIHLAILNKDVNCVKILLDHGANVYLPTKTPAWGSWDGLNSIELAKSEYAKFIESGGVGTKTLSDRNDILYALSAHEKLL